MPTGVRIPPFPQTSIDYYYAECDLTDSRLSKIYELLVVQDKSEQRIGSEMKR
jgi:hypothetical protein